MDLAIQGRHFSSLVALMLLLLGILFNIRNERRHIFRRPFNLVKAAYILARYVPLLALIANYVLVHVYLAPRRTSGFICRIWYSFLFLTLQLCSVSLNTVLFLRVYALYRKPKWLLLFLIPLFAHFVIPCTLDVTFFRNRVGDEFTPLCDKVVRPNEGLVNGILCVIIQTLLFVAVVAKRNASRQAVAKMVQRDSILVYVTQCVFSVILVLYTRLVSVNANPFLIFVWSITIASILTCKLILDMRKLPIQRRPAPMDEISLLLFEHSLLNPRESLHGQR